MNPCVIGIPLRLGCLIIGAVQIITALVECIAYTLGLIALASYGDLDQIKKIQGTFVVPFVNLDDVKIQQKDVDLTLTIIFSIALIGSVVYGLIGLLLLIATKKENLRYLKAWLICQSILILTALLYMVITLIYGTVTVTSLLCDFLTTCLQFYFLWVVYYYIVLLKDEQTLTLSPSIRKSGEKIDVSFPFDTFDKA